MKVPSGQFRSVVDSYQSIGLPILHESEETVIFEYGPVKLHIDRRQNFSQAELWLELVSDDLDEAESSAEAAGFARCDEIEDLGGIDGFWITNPASIVHLVTEDE
jgi:hypothetical protein